MIWIELLCAWAFLSVAASILWGVLCEHGKKRGYTDYEVDPRFEGDKIIYRS